MFFTKKFNLFVFVFVAFAAVLIVGMWIPLVINAAKYAQVSREIVDSGNWLQLTIAGEAYDQKPPLLFWLGALSFSIFGVSTFAFKLPIILYSFAGIFATYKLATILYNEKIGRMSAFFWGTSLGYFFFHNDIHADTLLATNVLIAIWLFTSFLKGRKQIHFYLGALFVGLAMLSKGPIGFAVPALAIGSQLIFQKHWKDILHFRWLAALLIVAIIISPALFGLYQQFGLEGIKFYFWTNNMGRITGSYQGGNTDPFFYFHNALYMFIPWTIFAFSGFFLEIKSRVLSILKKGNMEVKEYVTIGAILPIILILSNAMQKKPHYLLAITPLVMILAAKWVYPLLRDQKYMFARKSITAINYFMVLFLWVCFLSILLVYYPEKSVWIWIFVVSSFLILLTILLFTKGFKRQILTLLTTSSFVLLLVYTSVFPNMMEYHGIQKVTNTFNEQASKEDKLYAYRVRHWEMFFYAENYGYWIRTEKELPAFKGTKNVWMLTDDYGIGRLKAHGYNFEIIESIGHKSITGQSLKFIFSKDRGAKLSNLHLLRIN